MTVPLEGLKVVDFAEHYFVPAAAAVLAEWGADVIKIERREGDALRDIGHLPDRDFSYYFALCNRHKRGLALDVETPAGREILERLVRQADVYITNHLPRVQRRLRTSPADIFALNPGIVYARGSGQGQRGPDAEAGGNDNLSFWSRAAVAYMLSDSSGQLIPRAGPLGTAPAVSPWPRGSWPDCFTPGNRERESRSIPPFSTWVCGPWHLTLPTPL